MGYGKADVLSSVVVVLASVGKTYSVDVVVAASTGASDVGLAEIYNVLVEVVVQSSQALPFSDGQGHAFVG